MESPTYAAKPNDPSIEIARKNADSYLMEWKRNRREVEEKWKRSGREVEEKRREVMISGGVAKRRESS